MGKSTRCVKERGRRKEVNLKLRPNPRVMLSLLRSLRQSLPRRAPWRTPQPPKPASAHRRAYSDLGGEARRYGAKRHSMLGPTMLLVGVIPFFTFALGTWQVQRLQWKVNLIDEVREKMEREPIGLPKRVKCAALSLILPFACG